MRAGDWMNYEERFDAVAAHISDHLSEPLDLVRLAEVAGLSPKHWHRVFTSAFGESLAALVKRLRLQQAAFLLATTDLPTADIAATCGYPNVASFTRAFSAVYELPPGRYRAAGTHMAFARARTTFDPVAFTVEIRQVAPIDCLAVAHRGPYLNIGDAFRDLQVWISANSFDWDAQQLFGVFLDDPTRSPEAELRSLACLPRPTDFTDRPRSLAVGAAEIVDWSIDGGTYAVLRHEGPYSDMPAKYKWLFGCWVVASGHQLAELPVVERYLGPPHVTGPNHLLTEMWLPLQGA